MYCDYDHPILGQVEVEFRFESLGSAASYWDPGDPAEIVAEEVTREGIVWYLPSEDWEVIEEAIYNHPRFADWVADEIDYHNSDW